MKHSVYLDFGVGPLEMCADIEHRLSGEEPIDRPVAAAATLTLKSRPTKKYWAIASLDKRPDSWSKV